MRKRARNGRNENEKRARMERKLNEYQCKKGNERERRDEQGREDRE